MAFSKRSRTLFDTHSSSRVFQRGCGQVLAELEALEERSLRASISEFALSANGATPQEIAAGPDGALWFTLSGGAAGEIGRTTPAGATTFYSLPDAGDQPEDIVAGPDGAALVHENKRRDGGNRPESLRRAPSPSSRFRIPANVPPRSHSVQAAPCGSPSRAVGTTRSARSAPQARR